MRSKSSFGGGDRGIRLAGISLLIIAFGFGLAPSEAAAKRRKKKRRTPARKEKVLPAPPVKAPDLAPVAPSPEPVDEFAKSSDETLFELAGKTFADLEYDRALAAATALLAREGIDAERRMDAFVIQGSSLAIVGQGLKAERAFRLLLRARPDFDLPDETSPKILRVFRSVKVEEARIRAETEALQQKRFAEGISLSGGLDEEGGKGGLPLHFEFALKDRHRVTETLRLGYRKTATEHFSLLALEPDVSGRWVGIIPGGWTASKGPYELHYFVEASMADGRLLKRFGSEAAPAIHPMKAGKVPGGSWLKSPWFWTVATVIIAAGGAGGYYAVREGSVPASDLPPLEIP